MRIRGVARTEGTLTKVSSGLFAIATLAVWLGSSTPARAVSVQHVNGGVTNLVFSDNFENDSVGFYPADPYPHSQPVGNWTPAVGWVPPSFIYVTNGVSPGAADGGTKYLQINQGDGNSGRAWIGADFGLRTSGKLIVSWYEFIPTNTPDFLPVAELSSIAGSSSSYSGSQVYLDVKPATGPLRIIQDNAGTFVDTGVPFQLGVWQHWQIDYTFVSGGNNDTWTITVDNNTSGVLHGGYNSGNEAAGLRYLNFGVNAFNGTFFVDAPEPSSMALMAVGLLGLFRFRSVKRR